MSDKPDSGIFLDGTCSEMMACMTCGVHPTVHVSCCRSNWRETHFEAVCLDASCDLATTIRPQPSLALLVANWNLAMTDVQCDLEEDAALEERDFKTGRATDA